MAPVRAALKMVLVTAGTAGCVLEATATAGSGGNSESNTVESKFAGAAFGSSKSGGASSSELPQLIPSSSPVVPHTMLSHVAARAPHDVVGDSARAPDDVVVVANRAPDDVVAQSAPPQSVPQTMLSSSRAVPHTMLSPSPDACPTRCCRSFASVPQTMLSSEVERCPRRCCRRCARVPHTMLSPTASERGAPDRRELPGVAVRADDAARQPVVAPDDLLAPRASTSGSRSPGLRGA